MLERNIIRINIIASGIMMFVSILFIGAGCKERGAAVSQQEEKTKGNSVSVIVSDSASWYFIIFSGNRSKSNDTVILSKVNNYALLDTPPYYDSLRVISASGKLLNDSMVLVGYRDVHQIKVLQFYYPSKNDREKYGFLKTNDNQTFPIELNGLNQLDTIIKNISGK